LIGLLVFVIKVTGLKPCIRAFAILPPSPHFIYTLLYIVCALVILEIGFCGMDEPNDHIILNGHASLPIVNVDVCAKPSSTARVNKIKEHVKLFLEQIKVRNVLKAL